ncbi:MAG: hypothetical protein OXM02_07085 [Bacteroidota bacterium]|nr:hypothetical protein [Bacteroidota bacterium]
MQWHRAVWIALLPLLVEAASAQPLGAYRDTLRGPQPYILRSFVVPGTVALHAHGALLDTTEYTIDHRFGHLWIPSLAAEDTAFVTYQAWGLDLQETYRLVRPHRPQRIDTTQAAAAAAGPPPNPAYTLRHSGSITRGVLAGNNRDAIIESGLRLQLSGQVAKNVSVQAVLTDESVPIVPEGTTQRLEELDRVFIEIAAPRGNAQLGDIDIRMDETVFGRLTRKVQGVGVNASLPNVTLRATAATSRGVFHSLDVPILDGVQGPYMLTGAANEPFIFIIPGSERIYLDAQLLQRGETRDYTIDYATAELTFTASRLMRDHHRVVAEFEYRTTEFTRTLVTSDAEAALARWPDGTARIRLGAAFLREADGQAFDQQFGLTEEDRRVLEAVGDNAAERSGAIPVTYDPDNLFTHYEQIDTVISGQPQQIYRAVTRQPTGTVYRVHFSQVGTSRGSYVRRGLSTNGIVFEYRGEGRGDYAPVRVLPRPMRQQMVDLRGSFALLRQLEIFGEWAGSLYDQNRFSSLDADDDHASAHHGGLRLAEVPVGWGTASATVTRCHTGANFTAFSRIKPVEFHRQWQLPASRSVRQSVGETVDEAAISWQPTAQSSVAGTVGRIQQGPFFTGTRQEYKVQTQEAGLPQVSYQLHSIASQADSISGTWLRQQARLDVPMLDSRLTPSLSYKQNQRLERAGGGLTPKSSDYWQLSPSLAWQGRTGSLGAGVDWRSKKLWDRGDLLSGSQAYTLGLTFDLRPSRTWTTEGRIGWRTRAYSEYFRTRRGLADEQSLVMQWTGRLRPWKQALQVNWHYETLAERAPVMQEIFIRTGPELGEYVWEDANGNGVVDLDELIPETTQDEGIYARTLIPSDSFQAVTGVQARLSVTADPARIWRNAPERWKKRLSGVVWRMRVDIQEKSRTPRASDIYLMRLGRFRDEAFSVKGLLSVAQDVWLLRANPNFGAEGSWRMLRSLNALAAGVESRTADHWQTQVRWKPHALWGLRMKWARSHKVTGSESFASRRYDIAATELAPEVLFNPRAHLTFIISTAYSSKSAQTLGDAAIWKVPLEMQYSRAERWNASARMEWAAVTVADGTPSSGLAYYELTDGRGEGPSMLWRFNAWLQITRILRATFTYTGHLPHQAPPVHTARMQLGAVF